MSSAQSARSVEVISDPEHIYPYVVPVEYLSHQPKAPSGLTRELGNGLSVVLVHDLNGLVRNVLGEDLAAMKLTPAQAYERALKNLNKLAESGEIKMQVFQKGPSGQPFILTGGHWAAATAILLPKLREIAAGALKTDSICVSIPHREAMLIFPKGDAKSRQAFLTLIQEKEDSGRKPLTFLLFELTADGVIELRE